MFHYIFAQDYITQEGSHGKYPVKTCCVSDDLSGDMLAPELAQSSFALQNKSMEDGIAKVLTKVLIFCA